MALWGRRLQFVSGIVLVWLLFSNVIVTILTLRLIHSSHGINFQPQSVVVPPWVSIWLQVLLLASCICLVVGRALMLGRQTYRPRNALIRGQEVWIVFGWICFWFFLGGIAFSLYGRWSTGHSTILTHIIDTLRPVWLQIVAIFVVPIYFRGRATLVGLGRGRRVGRLILATMVGFVLLIIIGEVALWINHLMNVASESYREDTITRAFQQARSVGAGNLILQLVVTSVIAPVGEEMIFRGVLQSYFSQYIHPIISILLSSLAFCLFHADINLAAAIFVVGIILGVIRAWTGRIHAPILVHMMNNLVSSLGNL